MKKVKPASAKSDKDAKIVGLHIAECAEMRSVKNGTRNTCWGPTAWGEYGEPIITTERRYGKNGRVFISWLVFVCNDTECPARLHVRIDAILEHFQRRQP